MNNKEIKSNQIAAIDLLVEQLKNSSFATRYAIENKFVRNFSLPFEVDSERFLSCYVRPTNSEEATELDKITATINAKVEEDLIKYAILQDFQFIQSLKVGDKLPVYSNFENVIKESSEEIKHQAGEVILIDVWATWCGPCQSPMQHNQEMLEKNAEKWGDKVKIIGISIDKSKQDVVKRINDRKWEKIIHYKLNGLNGDHPIIKDFQIEGIPFVALVDTTGTLDYIGQPSKGNLEDRISALLEGKTINAQTTELNSDQYKKLKNLVEKELPGKVESNQYSFECNLTFTKTSLILPESVKKTYDQPLFRSSYSKKEQAAYKEFKQNLSTSLGEGFPLKIQSEKFKDVQTCILVDLKELKKIFESQDLKAIETQYQITTKLRLNKDGKLIESQDETFLQYSQLIAQDEAAKKNIKIATKSFRQYAVDKQRTEGFADYLWKFYEKGISCVEDSSKLVSQPDTDDNAYSQFKEIIESKKLLDLELKVDLPYDIKLSLVLRKHRVFDYQGQMKAKHHDKPILKYQVRSDHLEFVKTAVLDKLFTSLEQSNFVIKSTILNVVTFEIGKVCDLCKGELSIPQYYNYFKKQHICIECGDKRDETKKTIEQFAVPDNLVWLNSSQPFFIEEYKLGQNTQPKQDEEASFEFSFSCSVCENECTGRYICLSCRPGPLQEGGYIEFCSDCHKKLVVEKNAEILQKVQLDDPTHNLEHAILNVRTSAGDYFNF